jgi:threonine dehydrogenase-like Zn-dependent dehydrogenase
VAQATRMVTGRPVALRQAIQACRKGGTVSVPGVFGGFIDKVPIGAAFNKGLTFRMGQTHVHRYLEPLTRHIQNGDIDPSFVITHTVPLEKAPEMYQTFRDKEDGCIKVVLKPGMAG